MFAGVPDWCAACASNRRPSRVPGVELTGTKHHVVAHGVGTGVYIPRRLLRSRAEMPSENGNLGLEAGLPETLLRFAFFARFPALGCLTQKIIR
jgi:hypothetical protein